VTSGISVPFKAILITVLCWQNTRFTLGDADWSQNNGRLKTKRVEISKDDTYRIEKTPPIILHCRGNVFIEFLPNNDRGIHRETNGYKSNNSSIVVYIHYLGNVFTEPLPSFE
jgi:hypothetical protein